MSVTTTIRGVYNYTTSGRSESRDKAQKPKTPGAKNTGHAKKNAKKNSYDRWAKKMPKECTSSDLKKNYLEAELQSLITQTSAAEQKLGSVGSDESGMVKAVQTIVQWPYYLSSAVPLTAAGLYSYLSHARGPLSMAMIAHPEIPYATIYTASAGLVGLGAVVLVKLVQYTNNSGLRKLKKRVNDGKDKKLDLRNAIDFVKEEEEEEKRPPIRFLHSKPKRSTESSVKPFGGRSDQLGGAEAGPAAEPVNGYELKGLLTELEEQLSVLKPPNLYPSPKSEIPNSETEKQIDIINELIVKINKIIRNAIHTKQANEIKSERKTVKVIKNTIAELPKSFKAELVSLQE